MPPPPGISIAPLRTYLTKLPLLTVLISGLCVLLWVVEAVTTLPVGEFLRLDPRAMGLSQLHRINTYPLVHLGWLHLLLNLVAWIPLSERFEREVGSAKMGGLVLGPLVTIPAAIYLLVEMGLLGGSTSVSGLSALILTLITIDAVRTSVHQPTFILFGKTLSTLYTPVITLSILFLLFPLSSLLGHLCGVAVGYAYGLKYLSKLDPPDWILVKVEGKLSQWGAMRKLNGWGWVGVEGREEGRYMWLPVVRPRRSSTGVEAEEGRVGTVVDVQPQSAFQGVGMPLGS
ncbi:hypothetical protein BGX38DRAFT_711897 [Terfezia claveryi]|nr:hypothetical protein BGX38DRAFT_711897 [Terfezia claveryi]